MTFKENHEIIQKLAGELKNLRTAFYDYDNHYSIEQYEKIKKDIKEIKRKIEFHKNMRKALENGKDKESTIRNK